MGDGVLQRLFQVEEPILIRDGVPAVIGGEPCGAKHFVVVMVPPLQSADLVVAHEPRAPVVCGDTG